MFAELFGGDLVHGNARLGVGALRLLGMHSGEIGGAGAGMVYVAGKQDHKLDNARMIDHIVELVEAKAAELEAAELEATETDDGRAAPPQAAE